MSQDIFCRTYRTGGYKFRFEEPDEQGYLYSAKDGNDFSFILLIFVSNEETGEDVAYYEKGWEETTEEDVTRFITRFMDDPVFRQQFQMEGPAIPVKMGLADKQRRKERFLKMASDLFENTTRAQEAAAKMFNTFVGAPERGPKFGGLYVQTEGRRITGSLFVIYNGLVAMKTCSYDAWNDVPDLNDDSDLKPELVGKFLVSVVRWFMGKVTKGMPTTNSAALIKKWAGSCIQTTGIPRVLMGEVWLAAKEAVRRVAGAHMAGLTDAAQNHLDNRARPALELLKGGHSFVVPKVEKLDFCLSADRRYLLDVELSVSACGGKPVSTVSQRVPVIGLTKAMCVRREKLPEHLESVVLSAVWEVFHSALKSLPVLVRPLPRDSEIHQAMEGLRASHAGVEVWFLQPPSMPKYSVVEADEAGHYWEKAAFKGPFDQASFFPYRRLGLAIQAYSIHNSTALPGSILELAAFAREVGALYDETGIFQDIPEKPHLRFLANDEGTDLRSYYKFTEREKYVSRALPKPGDIVAGRIVSFFRVIVGDINAKRIQHEEKLASFNSLNVVQLEILKLLSHNGKMRPEEICAVIEKRTKATGQGAAFYLEELVEPLGFLAKKLTGKGPVPRPIYRLADGFDESYLALAELRPLDGRDVPHLKPSEKKAVIMRMVAEASGKADRWEVLQLMDQLPKAFLARFIKSDEGARFLSSLSGNDAMFANLLFGSLPGCKRIADELLKKKPRNK